MHKLTMVAAALSSVLATGYAVTAQADITPFKPSAYAESELLVRNFRLTDLSGVHGSLIPFVTSGALNSLEAKLTSTISSSINGVGGAVTGPPSGSFIFPLIAPPPTISHYASNGAYVPYASYSAMGAPVIGPGVFAGSASDHSGNGLGLNGAPPTTADTQAQVNINGSTAFGSADSRQTLDTTFTFTATSTLNVLALFDAEAFIRVALGQDDVNANATRSWGLTLARAGDPLGAKLVDWVPDGELNPVGGLCFGLGLCNEIADDFDLNVEGNFLNTGDSEAADRGAFGLRITLTPGDYTLTISHETNADAQAIPEPATLALLGLGLAGLGFARRKKQ